MSASDVEKFARARMSHVCHLSIKKTDVICLFTFFIFVIKRSGLEKKFVSIFGSFNENLVIIISKSINKII